MNSIQPLQRGRLAGWLSDVYAVTARNLLRLKRSPEIIIYSLLQPMMFVLLLTQVYGGAVQIQGTNYTQFLMAGIFGQTILFSTLISGLYIARDIQEGVIDRFCSLPMASSAILVARTLADAVVNVVSLLVMSLAGFLVGWRFTNGFGNLLLGMGLLLVTGWCFSWVMVLLGVVVNKPEALNGAAMIVLFPASFVSNAFVPPETLSHVLRVIAEWNPVSSLVQATRSLFGNTGSVPVPDVWPLQNPELATIAGWAVMLVFFPALATVVFRKRMRG